MPVDPLVKVYAGFFPPGDTCRPAVEIAGRSAVGCDEAWLFEENGLLRIAWEGVWFPLDDVLDAFAAHLPLSATGKLDCLDLEAWTLTRCQFMDGAFERQVRGLNHVLEYSGF